MKKVKYVDLYKQNKPYLNKFKLNFKKFIKSGNYILGDYVEKFEKKFSKYINVKYAVGVGSGTDALYLSLKSMNIGNGDEVITVANSYLATSSSIFLTGAKPVFVDVNYDLNIDSSLIQKKINNKTKAIIVVHLTGNPAKILEIQKIAKKNNIPIIEDAAQAVGASIGNKKVGSFGLTGCFSFHPLKNLNALGDAGIITTNNKKTYEFLIKARNHGHPHRDNCDFWSHNMRLDALQASFLSCKISDIDKVNSKRVQNAKYYNKFITDQIDKPIITKGINQVFHTYIIKTEKRDELLKFLSEKGVETKIHYPLPVTKMKAFKKYPKTYLSMTETLSKKILSLPIAEYLSNKEREFVVKSINSFFK